MLITLILSKKQIRKSGETEQYWICHSRVKRLQLQVRRLLRRLVAVRVKATDEINFKNKRRRQREMTSLHFPLNPRVFFTKWSSTEASNSVAASPAHLYTASVWHQTLQRRSDTSSSSVPLCHWYTSTLSQSIQRNKLVRRRQNGTAPECLQYGQDLFSPQAWPGNAHPNCLRDSEKKTYWLIHHDGVAENYTKLWLMCWPENFK